MSGKDEVDFRFLAENSVDIICSVGLDHVIHYVSPSSFRILGWKPEEMVGKVFDDFVLPEDLPALAAAAELILSPNVDNSPSTLRIREKDGSFVWLGTNARLARVSATGEPQDVVLVMRDITERRSLEERLAVLALTDGLTGISNRRAFDEALDREWKRTLREGSQISLLLLDLDHFKEFNDQYGHQVGDDCLRAVATAVRGAVRVTDIVARYGGEEITVILPSTATAGAVEAAEKVRVAIEALRFPHEGYLEGGGWVTASVGVATALARYGGSMRMPESLLLAADNALYKAKHEGRNRVATALLVAPKEN
jgi:diguanylate cyclase (GGDEF)-like protein/PAS domain S-box-containing protein